MDNFDKILNQLRDSSGNLKDNFHIIEEVIPIEEQMRYFEYASHIREQQGYIDKGYLIALLFSPDIRLEEKRYALTTLAGLTDISAFRALETYHSSPLEPELASWSAMAYIESKILLESDISGEKQILVSTGLGGVDDKLRFFAVIVTKNREFYSDLQKEILEREFRFEAERKNIIVEQFTFVGNHVKVLLLADLKHDLKAIIHKVVDECNEFGDFLDDKFLLTNLKQIEEEDLQRLLKKENTEDNESNE
ncbi:hypothetical protein D0T53_06740 [Dysgonomonas sp. 216]|uniref:hypothetical protein n=1 Tax=Dysgonomonas sp. 216 TaxID=2302934 RepID=UPI0013CF5E32|nr:hypothetical protein [Dysgonomonas sp. 216]NDW18611.1 hypothetical protein [Dysgonomonas sp. 216]